MNEVLQKKLQNNIEKLEILQRKESNLRKQIEDLERKINNQKAALAIIPKEKKERENDNC